MEASRPPARSPTPSCRRTAASDARAEGPSSSAAFFRPSWMPGSTGFPERGLPASPMIELVPFTEADIDRLRGWIRSPEELLLWTASSFGYPLTREHIQQHLRDSAAGGDRLIFKAIDSPSGETIGHVELGRLDSRNRSARIGRVLIA